MSAQQKLEILRVVETSPLPVREALYRLDVSVSTYYRWRRVFREHGAKRLQDRSPHKGRVWNQVLDEERDRIMELAKLYPEWSPREISFHVADRCGFTVSESTVYRLLKRAGLVSPRFEKGFPAGAEYRVKTRRPNEMWQTDATYLLIKNWGWYYLITVLDDYTEPLRNQTSRVGKVEWAEGRFLKGEASS